MAIGERSPPACVSGGRDWDEAQMSKAAAKNAKADAGKAAKKKPDPDGLKLIEEGDAAMNEKNFEKAIELFTAAKEKCVGWMVPT